MKVGAFKLYINSLNVVSYSLLCEHLEPHRNQNTPLKTGFHHYSFIIINYYQPFPASLTNTSYVSHTGHSGILTATSGAELWTQFSIFYVNVSSLWENDAFHDRSTSGQSPLHLLTITHAQQRRSQLYMTVMWPLLVNVGLLVSLF